MPPHCSHFFSLSLLRSWLLFLFNRSVMPNFLRPYGVQHSRLPCPSRVCSNSCSLSQWCHPTILSSVIPFSSCPQSVPASRSFPMSWLFTSGGRSRGASASASVLPKNIQGWFPFTIDWFDFLGVQGALKRQVSSANHFLNLGLQ